MSLFSINLHKYRCLATRMECLESSIFYIALERLIAIVNPECCSIADLNAPTSGYRVARASP
jgi:hypothetical protein